MRKWQPTSRIALARMRRNKEPWGKKLDVDCASLSDVPRRCRRPARGQDRAGHRGLAAGLVRRPAPPARLQGRSQAAGHDGRGGRRGRREDHDRRRRQSRRRASARAGSRRSSARSSSASISPAACTSASSDVPALARGGEASTAGSSSTSAIPTREFDVGTGKKRPGKRLLTVGTDCSIGKMYTALALEKEMQARGLKADFRATGQTGIFIAGDGVSIDAVVSDFVSGAVEWLSPANDARPLGPDRGPGLAVPRLLCRRHPRPDPRRAARCARHVPRADAPAHARPAALQAARPADLHRRQSRGGAADQSRRALRRHRLNTSALDRRRGRARDLRDTERRDRPARVDPAAHRRRRDRRRAGADVHAPADRPYAESWPIAGTFTISRGSKTAAEVVVVGDRATARMSAAANACPIRATARPSQA